MAKKEDLASAILGEAGFAQTRRFEQVDGSPIPFMLWVGDGRAYKASALTFELIQTYVSVLTADDSSLTQLFTEMEIVEAAATSIANFIDKTPNRELASLPIKYKACDLDASILSILNKKAFTRRHIFGCSFVRGAFPAISIGPAIFESRSQLVERMELQGEISTVIVRRLRSKWAGNRVRPVKNPWARHNETAILDAVGAALNVCTVETGNQSAKSSLPKALLIARVATTVIVLMWKTPSKALKDMGLSFDGGFHRQHYATTTGSGFIGSSSGVAGIAGGRYVDDDWYGDWVNFSKICGPAGEALNLYSDPSYFSERPNILKRLFISLWWFHNGCREQSDFMAVTKFAAAMDSLAGGNGQEGIKNLIEKRLERAADVPWLRDGRTPANLIREIYKLTRSPMIHGSMENFDRDWSSYRVSAEFVARECLVAALHWMSKNPYANDISLLTSAEPPSPS